MAATTSKKDAKRKAKDKTPVMEGQTEEERRILRQEQRSLHDRIGDRQQDLCELDHGAFEEERNNNNTLFKKVRFNREMVNDGDILVAMADVAVKRAGKLAKNVSQYNAGAIGRSLREEYGTESDMDWAKLGRDCAGIFRAPPELSFLCGPLQKPEKEKKKAERRKKVHDDDGEEETQYQTTSGLKEGEAQKEEATNLRLQKLNDVMLEKMQRSGVSPNATGDDRVKGLDLMSLVVNPNSFCETVENLFDLSFLVKDSKATIQIDEDTGLPTCRLTEPPEEAVPKTQNVVVLSMQDCKDIGDLWGISRPELERDDADAPASPAE